MTNRKNAVLPGLAGAVALTLALALTGCGGSSEPAETAEPAAEQEQATDDQSAPDETAETEVAIPEEVADIAGSVKEIAFSDETPSSETFDALPTDEDSPLDVIDVTDIAEGTEDSKAPSQYTILHDGGLQMTIPSKWLITQDDDGWVFMTTDQRLWGYMYSYQKPADTHYDLEAMAKGVVGYAQQKGWTNLEVINCTPGYSSSNTLCSVWVLYTGTYNGVDLAHLVRYVESKNYINISEFMGYIDAFQANINDIGAALDSVCFEPGESI